MSVWAGWFLLASLATSHAQGTASSPVTFSRDIQPLLAKHCVVCHGPDVDEAGLRLDRAGEGSESDAIAAVIEPGDAEASELLRRVTTEDAAARMPPDGDPLEPSEVAKLRQWIDQGAQWETHWAFQPVSRPAVPQSAGRADNPRAANPIDAFVQRRLEAADLSLSEPADRATLIKRLSYDLTGLPPTPARVAAFVADQRPDAYSQLVDRLLASPAFGERWGRHWLDKARYADSDGYEKDRPRPHAWRYRDWVIDAINRDLPFDQFTIEQLAGDLLPEATPQQQLATAFHRQTLTNTEGGTDQEEFRVEATFDRTETTAAIWMGLTMTCARCHNHKYDQIEQQEYYQLFAFFNAANEAKIDIAKSELAMQRYEQAEARHHQRVAEARQQYLAARRELQPRIDAWQRTMQQRLQTESDPPTWQAATIVDAAAASKTQLEFAPTGSAANSAKTAKTNDSKANDSESRGLVEASGPVPDKDQYTVVLAAPDEPLTGVRLDLLAADALPGRGPGRAGNGNFVLSHVRLEVSDDASFAQADEIPLVAAEADFAQQKFPPVDALNEDPKTGWAISPQLGSDHHITFWTEQPAAIGADRFLRLVLDQQYGGQHTIGRFRVSTVSGFDPLRALPEQVAEAVRTAADQRSAAQRETIADHVAGLHPETAELAARLQDLREAGPEPPLMDVRVMTSADRTTRVLHRGDFLQPADPVDSAVLKVVRRVHPLQARAGGVPDRLDFARWLVSPEHPLTGRVLVNQVWAHLFGRGLVPTINDFGVRGELPTHPDLLDWLAWQFPRRLDWSRKALIRLIVHSQTYRQASAHRPPLEAQDPTNRLFARQNRLRVEAEIVRDVQLRIGGLLSREVGGPSVFPPLPAGVAELSYANNFRWKTSEGGDRYRRGLYTFFKRTSPHPTLVSFDCPDSNTTRLQRATSNTPLQALATLNNDVFTEAAQGLTRRVLKPDGWSDRERLARAIALAVSRPAEAEELEAFAELLQTARQHYAGNPDDAAALTSRHRAAGTTAAENAAWVATTRMILNLDEVIVRD